MSAVTTMSTAGRTGGTLELDRDELGSLDASAQEPSSKSSSHPVFAAYLREVSKEDLLTRSEELALFTTIRNARDAAWSILTSLEHHMSPAERRRLHARTLRYEEMERLWTDLPREAKHEPSQKSLVTLYRAFNEWQRAREHLLKSNLRLVIYTVKRYRNEPSVFMDLIQEGNIGLMRAIDRYDPDRSSKFSTYALWWIWQAVNRAYAKNAYTIRIPSYKVQQVGRYRRQKQALASHLDRTPTDDEVAEAAGLSAEEVQQVTDIQARSVSLDELTGDEMMSLSEYLTSADQSPDAEAIHRDLGNDLRSALESLPSREAQVLRWHYGVDSEVYTLQEIGAKLNVSRERVRQLEQQAIRRILESETARRLEDYHACD